MITSMAADGDGGSSMRDGRGPGKGEQHHVPVGDHDPAAPIGQFGAEERRFDAGYDVLHTEIGTYDFGRFEFFTVALAVVNAESDDLVALVDEVVEEDGRVDAARVADDGA